MKKIEIKYRTWGRGLPPRPIKLDIPGWAGQPYKMQNDSIPQPWHCLPFISASIYGLELIWNFEICNDYILHKIKP